MTPVEKKSWVLSEFERLEKRLNGEASSNLHRFRQSALAKFRGVNFPDSKNEDWKYTPLPSLVETATPLAQSTHVDAIQRDPLFDRFPNRIVFLNGIYDATLSTPVTRLGGIHLTRLDEHPELLSRHLSYFEDRDENIFVFINQALLDNGVVITVPRHSSIVEPIHLIHVHHTSTAQLTQPFVVVIAEEGSRSTFFESSINNGPSFSLTNSVMYLDIRSHASVHLTKLHNDGLDTHRIDTMTVDQQSDSRLFSTLVCLGSAINRNQVNLRLNGEHIESTINGLSLSIGNQHIDNRTTIHHAMPNCTSHELYKSILDGRSTGVFNGKIMVHPDAQKTDAKQSNRNLLLSPDATMNTKPQLEIFADDVKCTHGATIGRLDEASLFYMRSRGIPVSDAKALLIHAFGLDVIERIDNNRIREFLDEQLALKLNHMKENA